MKSPLAILLVFALSLTSYAQCPGGRCPTNQRFGFFGLRVKSQSYTPQYVTPARQLNQVVIQQPVQPATSRLTNIQPQTVQVVPAQQLNQVAVQSQFPSEFYGSYGSSGSVAVQSYGSSGSQVSYGSSGSNLSYGCSGSNLQFRRFAPIRKLIAARRATVARKSAYVAPAVQINNTKVYNTVPVAPVQVQPQTNYPVIQQYKPPTVRQVSYIPPRSFSLATNGPVWNYYGSNLAGHLRNAHGIDPTGMNYAQMVAAHSRAHNSGR